MMGDEYGQDNKAFPVDNNEEMDRPPPYSPPAGNVKKLGGVVPVDMNHVASVCGFLQLIIAGLSLIAYICIDSRDYCFQHRMTGAGFFATMALSTFLTMLIWWVLETVMMCQKIRFITWRLWEMIILGIYGGLYLIGTIMIAAQTCGQGAIGAAAFFGFASVLLMGAHFYFSFKVWRVTESPTARRARAESGQPEQDPTLYLGGFRVLSAYPGPPAQ